MGEGDGFGPGVGVGAGIGVGEGVGDTWSDTFQSHIRETVPFSFVTTADTFHVPTAGLVFV